MNSNIKYGDDKIKNRRPEIKVVLNIKFRNDLRHLPFLKISFLGVRFPITQQEKLDTFYK